MHARLQYLITYQLYYITQKTMTNIILTLHQRTRLYLVGNNAYGYSYTSKGEVLPCLVWKMIAFSSKFVQRFLIMGASTPFT